MYIYKMKRSLLLIYSVIYVFGMILFILFNNDINSIIRLILFGVLPGIAIFIILFTKKLYVSNEKILIEWLYIIKKQIKYFYWNEIKKVEFKYRRVYLYSNAKKIIINSEWKNYKKIWLQIFEELKNHNDDNVIDKSFLTIINKLNESN